MKEKAFISIIVYLHNSEDRIENFLKNIDDLFYERFESYEIILLNDASTDNTHKRIEEFCKERKRKVNVINFAWKHGIETAMQAGLDLSIGDFIYEVDSPLINYSMEIFCELFAKATEGYDIVSAVPKTGTRITSSFFYTLFKRLSFLEVDLRTVTLRIVTRRTINAVSSIKDKVRYRKILYNFSGFPNTFIYYTPLKKNIPHKISLRERIKLSIDVLFSFSHIGSRISIYLSILFFFISMCIGIYAVFVFILYRQVLVGWTTTMLFLSLGFSGLFLILSFLSKYISLLLIETKTTPSYVIKSVERLPK